MNIFVCLLCVIISCVITAEWYDMDSVRFFFCLIVQRLQNHYFREMVWLIANNLNYEEGQKVLLRTRSPTIRKL